MATPKILKTQSRSDVGSRHARRERAAGRVPVNVYGHGEGNLGLAVDTHELSLLLSGHGQVFTLSIEGKEQPCLIKEVQYDTYGQHVLHVDFARISLTEEVEVEVALSFEGHPKGVAAGGVLAVHHPTLWVRCRADSIPDSIRVDISEIEMGHALHAREIVLPAGVVLDTHRTQPADQIVGVVAPRVEAAPVEEAAPVAGEPGAEGATPAGEGAPAGGDAAAAAPAEKGKGKGKESRDRDKD